MPVEPTSSHSSAREYVRPALSPLGTLADLTRGSSNFSNTDAMGDASGDEGSI